MECDTEKEGKKRRKLISKISRVNVSKTTKCERWRQATILRVHFESFMNHVNARPIYLLLSHSLSSLVPSSEIVSYESSTKCFRLRRALAHAVLSIYVESSDRNVCAMCVCVMIILLVRTCVCNQSRDGNVKTWLCVWDGCVMISLPKNLDIHLSCVFVVFLLSIFFYFYRKFISIFPKKWKWNSVMKSFARTIFV